MAGNDWINSYLEAILDSGPGIEASKSSLLLRERGRFSPTRYFVEEVITGFDETDLYKSWVRVSSICLGSRWFERLKCFFGIFVDFLMWVFRPQRRGVRRRGTRGWRTCAGGFGIWQGRRSRFDLFVVFRNGWDRDLWNFECLMILVQSPDFSVCVVSIRMDFDWLQFCLYEEL